MAKYVLAFDQSTQGTKCLLLDEEGSILDKVSLSHEQIINEKGWVSHNPTEIYQNVLSCAKQLLEKTKIQPEDVTCIGISNQRETSVVWEKETRKPVCDAIVWQCSRAKDIVAQLQEHADYVQEKTGIPFSPYFPAAKFAWILENIPEAKEKAQRHELCFGTIDTWLLYCMTNGSCYKTDYSNASRTQLFDLETLTWNQTIVECMGLCVEDLPEVCDSDSCFGITSLQGILPREIPIHAMLGDSHAALFGQGCLQESMAKATYGTGSSIMMNVGNQLVRSKNGLASSLAFKYNNTVSYVLEGNINYTGAVITWLKDDVQLVASPSETEEICYQANPEDTTYFVPAFTGLGAPYWNNDATAMFTGITRTTGKKELIKAGVECIAYQIQDIVSAMESDTGNSLKALRVDGGPTGNKYLMQFQSDLLNCEIVIPEVQELSALGAAYMAGISQGLYSEKILEKINRKSYEPKMDEVVRKEKVAGWKKAIAKAVE